jgi:hypothetical protein
MTEGDKEVERGLDPVRGVCFARNRFVAFAEQLCVFLVVVLVPVAVLFVSSVIGGMELPGWQGPAIVAIATLFAAVVCYRWAMSWPGYSITLFLDCLQLGHGLGQSTFRYDCVDTVEVVAAPGHDSVIAVREGKRVGKVRLLAKDFENCLSLLRQRCANAVIACVDREYFGIHETNDQ